jgi:hypothetical protein
MRGGHAYALLAALLGWQAAAGAAPDGRWEGLAQTPAAAVPVVIDILTTQTWIVTLPGRSTQRERLAVQATQAGWLRASGTPGQDGSSTDTVRIEVRQGEGGRVLRGTLHQGGHAAPLRLVRVGEASALDTVPSATLPTSTHGVWRGRYDMGFGERNATLRVSAQAVAMTVVGRRASEIAFDEARQRGALLMLQSSATGVSIEAPAAGAAQGVLQATLRQGPFEAQFELKREVAP